MQAHGHTRNENETSRIDRNFPHPIRQTYGKNEYLQLLCIGLECMYLDNLLKPVETDQNEGVVQFGRGRFRRRHLVDEEPVQTEGLLVHDVLQADLGVGGAAGRGPVFAQAGFLKKKNPGICDYAEQLNLAISWFINI